MRRTQTGFTLIELMIVVAIIAIIAAIAIPNLMAARLNANETSTVATLRSLATSQGQFQVSAKADVDGDGAGEFGMFRELSGVAAVRTAADGTSSTGSVLNPPVLSGAFRNIAAGGYVSRSGYVYRLWLPGTNGNGIGENTTTGLAGGGVAVHSDLAETKWCCYAWPAKHGSSGNRSFFVNQAGDITATDATYTAQPGAGAAFVAGGSIHNVTGTAAVGTVGRDANIWRKVN